MDAGRTTCVGRKRAIAFAGDTGVFTKSLVAFFGATMVHGIRDVRCQPGKNCRDKRGPSSPNVKRKKSTRSSMRSPRERAALHSSKKKSVPVHSVIHDTQLTPSQLSPWSYLPPQYGQLDKYIITTAFFVQEECVRHRKDHHHWQCTHAKQAAQHTSRNKASHDAHARVCVLCLASIRLTYFLWSAG